MVEYHPTLSLSVRDSDRRRRAKPTSPPAVTISPGDPVQAVRGGRAFLRARASSSEADS